jgi:type VI secretion system protein VasD
VAIYNKKYNKFSNLGFAWLPVISVIAIMLSSCALFGPGATRVEATIKSTSDINPNLDNKPSPLVIRIFELKSIDAFQNNDFFSLYDNESESIGKDILAKNEIEVRPGEKYKYNRDLNVETRYLGVIAAYRNLDNSQWRASIEVPLNKKINITIQLRKLAVSINSTK